MSSEKARTYFHGVEGLNCAQAIIKAFASDFKAAEAWVSSFSAFGGGRAPEGRCGALHAARALLGEGAGADELEKHFVARTGSAKCRDIRGAKQVSCVECVQTAADLVEAHQAGNANKEHSP